MNLDLNFVDETVDRCGRDPAAVIPILQSLQEHYRYLPQEALERVCALTEITPASVAGVSTFYDRFRHRPVGQHIVRVCQGTACHVKGAGLVQDAVAQQLDLAPGEDTDTAGRFTVQPVACLGCCTLAPVLQIDEITYGRLTAHATAGTLTQFLVDRRMTNGRKRTVPAAKTNGLGEIRVGLGSCCVAQGSGKVYDAICDVLDTSAAGASVKRVGCVGMCHQTPLVELVAPDGKSHLYSHVQPDAAREIVLRHFKPRGLSRRFARWMSQAVDRIHTDEGVDLVQSHAIDVRDAPVCAFLGPQRHLATEYCGHIDPLDLDEYLRHDGFRALERCVTDMRQEEIVQEVRESGLRGRGGAGFATHIKWELVRKSEAARKYVICNGDEGDPGAFMDRMLLESFPYRVIEGMAIAARAVGAEEGWFYIRAEYPLAVQRIREAVRQCEARGLLGDAVMGSAVRLRVSVKEGAGAFICGEETALIHSLEGGRGTPWLRPPYPAEAGLHGQPTLINNVETLALVPWIVRHGAHEFAAIGTEKSKGTKVFALAGRSSVVV